MVAVAMGDSCPANRDASFAVVAVTNVHNVQENNINGGRKLFRARPFVLQ